MIAIVRTAMLGGFVICLILVSMSVHDMRPRTNSNVRAADVCSPVSSISTYDWFCGPTSNQDRRSIL